MLIGEDQQEIPLGLGRFLALYGVWEEEDQACRDRERRVHGNQGSRGGRE